MLKIVFYIFTLLLTFSFAFLVGGPMPYFIFYISLLAFLIPLSHILVSFIGIKANINIPKVSLYTGSEISINYKIENKNIFPIPLLKLSSNINKFLSDASTGIKTISLGPREKFEYKEKITLKRRGFYELMDLDIIMSDVFNIFSLKKKFHKSSSILVYPNIIELDDFRVTSDKNLGEILVKNSIFDDKSSVSTIRDYVEGDAINEIHWKVSAKRGSPMIKKFETVSNANVNIFIDNEKAIFKTDFDRNIEDKIVDSSLAIINYFLNLDIDLTLTTSTENGLIEVFNKKKDELKFFLELFARFKANGKYKLSDLIENKFYSFIDNSIIIIITPNLNKELGAIAIKLKMKNLIPILLVVTDKENNNIFVDKTVEKRMLEENIDLYFIDCKSNIKEELEIKHG